MVNHGITTGGLFLCVGIIYDRTHSRLIADNVGLAKPMPRYATCLVIFALSSLGLPGTNSFVGEFLVLAGTFLTNKLAATLALLGIILAAAYLLWMVQRVAFGVPSPVFLPKLHDVNVREAAALIPLVILVFWIGVFPNPLVGRLHPSVNQVLVRALPQPPAEIEAMRRHDDTTGPEALPAPSGEVALVQRTDVADVPSSNGAEGVEPSQKEGRP
jgi:NADH-quinone oxidoreductase subunit M